MKKLVIVYVILIVAVVLLAVFKAGGKLPTLSLFGKSEATVNGKKITLLVAKSENDKIKGLSGRKSLPQDQGMLFVFENRDKHGFWMKGMLFGLDIIFINDNKVVDLFEKIPPPGQAQFLTIYRPESPANYVLELNSGASEKLGIKKGTKITFKGI